MAVTITVETGAGIPSANAYESVADWKAYADAHQFDYTTPAYSDDAIAGALIRGTAYIDGKYRAYFPGTRTNGRAQGLLWPRRQAAVIYGIVVNRGPLLTITDSEGYTIPVNAIPQEIKDATAEAAWRELQNPNSLVPDLERGGAIRALSAGSVSIEYATTAPVETTFRRIDDILSGILYIPRSTGYTARAVEG